MSLYCSYLFRVMLKTYRVAPFGVEGCFVGLHLGICGVELEENSLIKL